MTQATTAYARYLKEKANIMTIRWSVLHTVHKQGRPWRAEVRQWAGEQLYVVVSDGRRIDYPIRYRDGRIAYDYPEIIPQYARPLVGKAYLWLDQQE